MPRFGRVPGLVDESSQPVYDTLIVAAGTLTYRFFTVPVSGAKSRLFTNMTNQGVLASPQSFLVYAVRIILKEATSAQADAFINRTRAVFKVGEKEALVAPACLFSAGAGLYSNTAVATDRAQNGDVNSRSIWTLDKPVQIGVNQSFYLDILYDVAPSTAEAGFYVLCVLDGVLTRGVQ